MKTRTMNGWSPSSAKRSWHAGKADDLGPTHFRSTWERNYARYLNFLVARNEIRKWEYEAETFWFEGVRRGVVSYKPDFRVTTNRGAIEYHEVKGWMDPASVTKLKRMAKYHPQVKIVLIDRDVYRSLCRFGKMFSPYWEDSKT